MMFLKYDNGSLLLHDTLKDVFLASGSILPAGAGGGGCVGVCVQ